MNKKQVLVYFPPTHGEGGARYAVEEFNNYQPTREWVLGISWPWNIEGRWNLGYN